MREVDQLSGGVLFRQGPSSESLEALWDNAFVKGRRHFLKLEEPGSDDQ
ncbi:hypothetical protein [Salinarimonas chemoclinalis]